MSFKKQHKVIQLFNNLFESGFNLTEIVSFLRRSQLLLNIYVERIQESLLNSISLATMMADLGFSDNIATQVALADVHGDSRKSLLKIEFYLSSMTVVRKKLIEVATYPLILLSFLILVMSGLKNYLLPQLESQDVATQVITHSPTIFSLSIFSIGVLLVCATFYARRLSQIDLYSRISRIPFVGNYVRSYLTAYYAREWGNLIRQGIELMATMGIMQK